MFSWTFEDVDPGDVQTAYELEIEDANTGVLQVATGKISVNNDQFSASLARNPIFGQLDYNTTYSWRLRVWDSFDKMSDWEWGADFSTPLHVYPDVNFEWIPSNPSQGEFVQLCSVQEVDCSG